MKTETKNSLIVFLLLVVLVVVLGFGGFQLKRAVEKRDARPTIKMMEKSVESKTDSADAAKLPAPATLPPK